MTVEKEPAACSIGSPEQAARQNLLLSKAYLKAESLSSLKTLIGGLLLFGNRSQKVFWPFFDVLLRQYVDLRLASQSASDKPGSKHG